MIKDLLYYGNPGLRKKCVEVTEITDEVKQIAQDLIETVLEKDGAGLAAPQIGYFVRMFVSRYDNGTDSEGWPILCPPKIYINPVLSKPSERVDTHGEGCLSIPGIYEEVTRPWEIHVDAMDLEGNIFTEVTTGWRARNVMHENDHINGVLFIDRIDPKKRKKIDPVLRSIKKKYN
ncbi:MAG: peptide deformylase [Simkaniaceae bacterium]|nr:MAG: peptide deformylase [Simkaniaceae bacterium]